jgi:hypothetical protein
VKPNENLPSTVPPGMIYVELDDKGQELRRYEAGAVMKGVVDCAVIPCPPTLPKNAVCWHCKSRSATPINRK